MNIEKNLRCNYVLHGGLYFLNSSYSKATMNFERKTLNNRYHMYFCHGGDYSADQQYCCPLYPSSYGPLNHVPNGSFRITF